MKNWCLLKMMTSYDSHMKNVKETVLIKCIGFPANVYLFEVSNRNTKKRCQINSKLTIKIPQQC